jgi:hypothetical protein
MYLKLIKGSSNSIIRSIAEGTPFNNGYCTVSIALTTPQGQIFSFSMLF